MKAKNEKHLTRARACAHEERGKDRGNRRVRCTTEDNEGNRCDNRIVAVQEWAIDFFSWAVG